MMNIDDDQLDKILDALNIQDRKSPEYLFAKYKYRLISNNRDRKNNLMLHAYKIKFIIDGKKYNFSAEPSFEFKKILKEKSLKIF